MICLHFKQSVCCKNGDRVETYSKKEGFDCCGHYYYNKSLWQCSNKKLIEVFELKLSALKLNGSYIFSNSRT